MRKILNGRPEIGDAPKAYGIIAEVCPDPRCGRIRVLFLDKKSKVVGHIHMDPDDFFAMAEYVYDQVEGTGEESVH